MPRYSTFLSYSRKDQELIAPVKAALERERLSHWLDTSEIGGGDLWEALIRRALTQSNTLVVFVTKNLVGSFGEKEIDIAIDIRKPVIPLVFDDTIDGTSDIVTKLRQYHFIDFRKDADKACQEAVRAVAKAHLAPVIASYNVRGGVGKTTLAMQVSSYLFKRKSKRVLLIDTDPQANLSTALIRPKIVRSGRGLFEPRRPPEKINVLRALQSDKKSILGVIEQAMFLADNPDVDFTLERYIHTIDEGDGGATWDIVVGDFLLRRLATDAKQADVSKAVRGFSRFVGQCRRKYDFVMIDMNPSVSTISRCVLAAATHIISPVKPDLFSMQGLDLLEEISADDEIEAKGCEQLIVLNDTKQDSNGVVRNRIKDAFGDRLLEAELVSSSYFYAAPAQKVSDSFSWLPAYGAWSPSPSAARQSLERVACEVAHKVGLRL